MRDFARLYTTLDETTVVLLCFENLAKPGLWCHRTMFAEWWTGETGELVIRSVWPGMTTRS